MVIACCLCEKRTGKGMDEIKRISNDELVDISFLNTKELKRLHYEEERYVAEQILKCEPFSEERFKWFSKGYEIIDRIKEAYGVKENSSKGACQRSVSLVCGFIKKENKNLVLFEAGTGSGFSCECFMRYPNITYIGCDLVIRDSAERIKEKYGSRIILYRNSLYDSLKKLEDHSIDYFYADNVFEHLIPDELPQIFSLLKRKLKNGAWVFLFIPNRISGPHDISGKFQRTGTKASGFHYMEETYKSALNKYEKVGLTPAYVTLGSKNKIIAFKDYSGKLNRIKITMEGIARILPGRFLKKAYIRIMCLDCYVLKNIV